MATYQGPKYVFLKLLERKNNLWKEGAEVYLNFGSESSYDHACKADVNVNGQPFSNQVSQINNSKGVEDYFSTENAILNIGDGKISLKTLGVNKGIVRCIVMQGGTVDEGKGLTIKGASLKVKAFQEQDKKALDFLLDHGGEVLAYIAVSFVQDEHDIRIVKKHIYQYFSKKGFPKDYQGPGVIAKIETRSGWDNIDDILDVADGIMVARGDLGEQLPPEEIPNIQKELIQKCNIRGKPVITATQMMDSMEVNPEPTRAEATDVFNAILDGTDAVMLSGETSKGKFPIESIKNHGKDLKASGDALFCTRK